MIAFSRRSVYLTDIFLFAVLAMPVVNEAILRWILRFGAEPGLHDASMGGLVVFVGLLGTLGLGFSLLRLSVPESIQVVTISALVKLLASIWLFAGFVFGVSSILLVLAIADMAAAMLLAASLLRPGSQES